MGRIDIFQSPAEIAEAISCIFRPNPSLAQHDFPIQAPRLDGAALVRRHAQC